MSALLEVNGNTPPELARLAALARRPRGLVAAVGKRGEVELRGHFARRDREPNAKGWPRTHFWARRIRANTALASVTDTAATITIAAPEFAQKLHGGTITPKEAKFLAIPARREAAGKSPRSFVNLRFIPTQRGGLLVAQGAFQGPTQRGIRRIGAGEDGGVYYFLVKSATQDADPHALPQRSMFEAALVQTAREFIDRESRAS